MSNEEFKSPEDQQISSDNAYNANNKPEHTVRPTAPLSKSLFRGNPVRKYPLDLESANGHYMVFNIHARIDQEKDMPATDLNLTKENFESGIYNDTFTRERFFDDMASYPTKIIKDAIVLYMPDDLSVTYKSNYEAAEIGTALGTVSAMSDLMKGNTSFKDAAKSLGMQTGKLIDSLVSFGSLGTAQGTYAAIQRKTGVAAAPLQEMIFQGVDYRTFNYTFKMTPRNRKEAQEIKDIIDTFTFHMLPEKLGSGAALAYRVPSEFTIRYMYRGYDNAYLNSITYCALTDMKVDYNSGEKFATYRPDDIGAPPISTSVTLTFQELELIDRRRAKNGTHKTRKRVGGDYD